VLALRALSCLLERTEIHNSYNAYDPQLETSRSCAKEAKLKKSTDDQKSKSRIAGASFDVQSAIVETLRSIEAVKKPREALQNLTAAGCDQTAILKNLYAYCGPIPLARGGKVDVGLRDAREFTPRLGALVKRLKEDADDFERVVNELQEYAGMTIRLRFAEEVRSKAKFLEVFYEQFRKGRPAISRRNRHLFYLGELVLASTGSPHYEDLAELVSAVQSGKSKMPTRASIYRKVSRFRQTESFLASQLKEEAEAEVDEWKVSVRANTRLTD
jgi:hypothetical protein